MSERFKAFPGVVCERIRRHVALRTKCESERKGMFEARDKAAGDCASLGKDEKARREKCEADYGRAVMEIDRLGKTIKWCNSQLQECVEKADQPGLFDSAEIEVPDFSEADQEEEDDGRPVGTASPTKPRDEDGPGSANTRRMQIEEAEEGGTKNGVAGTIGRGGRKKADK